MSGVVWHNASWWPLFVVLLGGGAMVLILGWRLRRSQQSLLPGVFGANRSSRPLLTFVGSLLVGVAILDPRWSSETIELPFRGRNVVVLLDASGGSNRMASLLLSQSVPVWGGFGAGS